jgi:hypothetical protein
VADEVPRDVFAALERARPELLRKLSRHGVVRIEWVVGFVKPYRVSAWLGTETDAERDALPSDPFLVDVREILESAGLPRGKARLDGTVAQSQETVDRDYQGSWFYALR